MNSRWWITKVIFLNKYTKGKTKEQILTRFKELVPQWEFENILNVIKN